ncbi:hypothetical protein ACM15_23650 [Parabacteroides goldsteinii]|uniref:Glycosyltransferase 2-like domain-containing protein n=1 Tax=Parabacteroides goldsteinii TaxID=328812 RepID=A0A0J6CDM1_9BACT|nr:glycosyltransferase family A protein [Parabacteroides goldsteinii]KMM31218.1 hypothetical protein ACM15_23650 [Parabacteroides goldsteinii]
MITIFTPTYNRKYTIGKLYESLCCQNVNNFEWLIVDDGSTDGTDVYIQSLVSLNFNIRYYYKKNEGKSKAINYAVGLAKGDWFFIVDSDDYLVDNALSILQKYLSQIENQLDICAIVANRITPTGKKLGNIYSCDIFDTDISYFRSKYKFQGDYAEIFRTSVMKEYPFPEFEGEKYCTESLVWYRMAQKYKFRYINEDIYVCEYLLDGITNSCKVGVLLKQNPQYYTLYFKEQFQYDISFIDKLRVSIHYWNAYKLCKVKSDIIKPILGLYFCYPLYLAYRMFKVVFNIVCYL